MNLTAALRNTKNDEKTRKGWPDDSIEPPTMWVNTGLWGYKRRPGLRLSGGRIASATARRGAHPAAD